MDTATFNEIALACAPAVHAKTARALVAVESNFNPYAIGVVGGVLDRQPRSYGEAITTARQLKATGWNFSVGLAQINVRNFERLGLTTVTAFDACKNLRAMEMVLTECFTHALPGAAPQTALRQSLSCYYSGNAVTGFRHGYVQKVISAAR